MKKACPKCGRDLALVGVSHNCVPSPLRPKVEAVTRAVVWKMVSRTERSAVKSIEPAPPVMKGRGRPAGSPYSGRVGVLIKFDPEAVAWMDGEFVRRKLASRVDLIRALVDEARSGK